MFRRSFMQTGALLAAGSLLPSARPASAASDTVLNVDTRVIEVNGKAASVLGISQANGTRGLFIDARQPFRVEVRNRLDRPSLIHWHGLLPPYQQDGVPWISAPPIPPGASALYNFKLGYTGTYWMHSHVGFQEQELLAAPLIIRGDEEAKADRQEVVVMFNDFTFDSPDTIFARLRQAEDSRGGMNMQKPDLNDVDYDAFLANDRTLADPEVVRIQSGGRLRLRLINASSATNYWIDLGSLNGTLVAVDGEAVKPMQVANFPLGIAQRADILLDIPAGQSAYPVLAQVEGKTDRTGIILATAGAPIQRIPGLAEKESPPTGLAFESRLSAATPLSARRADAVIDVPLTGDMAKYIWMMNNQVFPAITPLTVKAGQRVELVMQNRTMMAHPMHLHGHRFQVVGIDGKRIQGAVRDSVMVPAAATVTIAFDTNNPGRWAFHCHNLYHLEAGMMAVVDYEGVPMPKQLAGA